MKKTYSDEMRGLLETMHESRPDMFNGASLQWHIEDIDNLMKKYSCETILDYGCGKAEFHPHYWNAAKYDLGHKPYNTKPEGTYDMVVSTDMLEHIEYDYLDNVLDEIYGYADKCVFLTISTRLAHKTLPDGRNAHIIVETPEWWMDRLDSYIKVTPSHIKFDGIWIQSL